MIKVDTRDPEAKTFPEDRSYKSSPYDDCVAFSERDRGSEFDVDEAKLILHSFHRALDEKRLGSWVEIGAATVEYCRKQMDPPRLAAACEAAKQLMDELCRETKLLNDIVSRILDDRADLFDAEVHERVDQEQLYVTGEAVGSKLYSSSVGRLADSLVSSGEPGLQLILAAYAATEAETWENFQFR